ncbi:MAG: Gldg family protein [Planctomycetota bacterium]
MYLLPIGEMLVFLLAIGLAVTVILYPISRVKQATFAVLRRNFVGYFSNPTGYVFICVFMLLSSIAAFWPDEFFSSNLATLDQLDRWFPMIMLVFIPAITMSIWSEERQEGTDELLLTIPATDGDIVLGKYLAAVSIFSISLLFSMLTNFIVLASLADWEIDGGLFISTYIGYWFIGIAMLALGMIASFLTSNLTVAFILGALFNAPLVFLSLSDRLIASRELAQSFSWWSYSARFADFGRGVVSLSGILFFTLVAAIGVYISTVLIGRRHWMGAKGGESKLGHYLIRIIALVAVLIGASKYFGWHDLFRTDLSTQQLSSLSPDTKLLLQELDTKHDVVIDAYVSPSMPEQYVKTKVDLLNMLRALEANSNRIKIRLYDKVEPFSEQATQAEEQYGIMPQSVTMMSRGGFRQEELFLGAAVTCGLQRVVIPFFDRGIPVEYELMRSINTVVQDSRKKIGVVQTDAQLFGGFDMQRMAPRTKELILEELEKQYDVEQVDLTQPVDESAYDVLMVVQPSSLPQAQLDHLVGAIRNGVPTAIFEDPDPVTMGVPATSEPRRSPGGMFGGGQQPEPKGNIQALWDTLGIDMVGVPGPYGQGFDAQVVWQDYNPYGGKVTRQFISPEWVFVTPNAPGADNEALNVGDGISSGLGQILFLHPGAIRNLGARGLEFTPLAKTGDRTGALSLLELRENQRNPALLDLLRNNNLTRKKYVIAARIKGYLKDDLTMSDLGSPLLGVMQSPGAADPVVAEEVEVDEEVVESDDGEERDAREKEIHVVYVSDIDLLSSQFLNLRAQPQEEINWDFDNVTFVLNVLDSLADDESLMDIRKRKIRHSTLKKVEEQTELARNDAMEAALGFEEVYNEAVEEAKARIEKNKLELAERVEAMQREAEEKGTGRTREMVVEMMRSEMVSEQTAQKLELELKQLEAERDKQLKKIENTQEMRVREVQTKYKLRAAFLPLIPPFAVGLLVWYLRHKREREGVQATRLR